MNYQFWQRIRAQGKSSYLEIPFNVWQVCRQSGSIPVRITLDNCKFETQAVSMGKGLYRIPIRQVILSQLELDKEYQVSMDILRTAHRKLNDVKETHVLKLSTALICQLQPSPGTCVATCIGMLANVSAQDVINKTKSRPWYVSWIAIQEALQQYHIAYSHHIVYTLGREVVLPSCCIIREKGQRCDHCLIYCQGIFYDPTYSIRSDFSFSTMIAYMPIPLQ